MTEARVRSLSRGGALDLPPGTELTITSGTF